MRDDHALGTPSFQAEPLVLGVIGDVTKANLQSARPRLQHLRAMVETPRLTVMSNRRLPNWRSDSGRGWFWHPIAKGVTPASWIEAQNEAMAPGVAQQDEEVRLHNDRLGLHQLYYFETIDLVVFSNWLPILVQLSRGENLTRGLGCPFSSSLSLLLADRSSRKSRASHRARRCWCEMAPVGWSGLIPLKAALARTPLTSSMPSGPRSQGSEYAMSSIR